MQQITVPRNSRRKLFTSPSKTKGTTSSAAVPKDPTQTAETAFAGDVVDPASKTNVSIHVQFHSYRFPFYAFLN